MAMTINDIKHKCNGTYNEFEVYVPTKCHVNHFHTDNCRLADNYMETDVVAFFELMNVNTYNNTILANSVEDAREIYPADTMFLCCMLK